MSIYITLKSQLPQQERYDAIMTNENREGFEIDLEKLFLAFLGKWWMILICVVLGVALSAYYTTQWVTPMYQASVTIYVNNVGRDQKVNYITNSNLATAQKLVNTYIYIIKSDTVLEKVADAADLGMTAPQLRSCLRAAQKGETELFDVTITHENSEMAARIANALAEVAPGEIENFVEGSSTKVIDYAKVPKAPSTPKLAKNLLVGAGVGFLIAAAYITILFLLDVRIKDEDELVSMFDLPVLGQIPVFLSEGAKARGSYEKKGYVHEENGGNER